MSKGGKQMANILLVEDNESIINGLVFSFKEENLNLDYKKNVKDTIEYLKTTIPDLIILDISLPDGNGFDLYKNHIKEKNIGTIFLTAKDDENDIVKGLEIGAEDYITKPFFGKELIARVKKILLRNKKESSITIKNITFDLDEMTVTKNNQKIEFTALELKILSVLLYNKNKLVRRETLLDKIWEWTGNFVDDHTVTVYLKRIKDKLGEDIITTVKGLGYRIDEK